MKKINFKKAYTMAELVAAMIVIGMLIIITTGITKSKVTRVQKYHYYAAYTMLTSVASEILAESDDGLIPDDTNICSEFEDRLNLFPGDVTVNDSEVTPSCSTVLSITETDFSAVEPNIVTRNGLRFYFNNTDTPLTINELSGSAADEDGQGYIIYIDIDGDRNPSELYTDVFPFFLTRTGKVIPAYHTQEEDDITSYFGGNSTDAMVFSVRYETVEDVSGYATLKENLLVKSVSFQEAACKSGYVTSETYCDDYDIADECTEDDAECVLVPLKPVKYLVK